MELTEYAGNPAKNRQADVDEEVGAAASLQKDRNWRKEEGEEVEEDVALSNLSATYGKVPIEACGPYGGGRRVSGHSFWRFGV